MKTRFLLAVFMVCFAWVGLAGAALVVPNEIQQPGTQPGEVGNLESPDKCDNCHGGYNKAVEPAFNWRGSMMANAGRDPIFWATMAIAEQDFDGAGDLCIRCHSTGGWYGGRSTPTDGSALTAMDADGVDCDTCHKMTNPNNREHLGVMNPPFVANDEPNDKQTPATGYNGSGMLSLWGGSAKLGPYSDATARHQSMPSQFHRDIDFCGSCHDVSNPAVGDLAPNNGKQSTGDPVVASGTLGSPVDSKAAFNNFPFQYGIVERTFSEFKAGLLSTTPVSNYTSLPADLQAGAIQAAFNSAKGNYSDGTPRVFSCQTCHLRAVTGQGCNKNPAVRTDLPLHDMTGGNYWMPDAIQYQNGQGTLRLGGGLTVVQTEALNAGKERALQQLQLAASLAVNGKTLKVTNLTGHKLISGYPEGRRMWLNIKWYDASNNLVREDGKYGDFAVAGLPAGSPGIVQTILNLDDPNTKVYEAHYAMTKEWADQLLALGYPATMALSYDRVTGAPDYTLGDLAGQAPGTYHETFHFVLNNHVAKDNRIPPYGMSYDKARERNALPVPANQYGSPAAGGTYNYWDEVTLNPPSGASYATIDLLYQSTSWEYIQFLYKANNGQNAFLGAEGINLLKAWLNTGMAAPVVMASATWGTPPQPVAVPIPTLLSATPAHTAVTLTWSDVHTDNPAVTGYNVYYDQGGKALLVASVGTVTSFTDTGLTNGIAYSYKVTATAGTNESAFSNILTAMPVNNSTTTFLNVPSLVTGQYQKVGSGKTATTTFVTTTTFKAGSSVVFRMQVKNVADGTPVSGATVNLAITGGQNVALTSAPTGSDGFTEVTWMTTAPNRKGTGGTPPGTYIATVEGVTLTGAVWDGIKTSTTFVIQ